MKTNNRWTPLSVALLASVSLGSACGGAAEAPKSAPAATVQNAPQEDQLSTVTLAPQAETRLGVELAVVEKRSVARSRKLSGEIMTPLGKSNIVTAPIGGTVLPANGSIKAPGAAVRKGDVVLRLMALPPAGDLAGPEIRLEAAKKRAARAEQLLKDGAGSRRALEDAQAELDLAEAAFRTSRPRAAGADDAIAMTSPQDGVLRAVHVGAGQAVSGGTALFEVESLGAVWVRVPVYVGDLADIAPNRPARVSMFSADQSNEFQSANPVSGPPSANPDAATSDLYFELPNPSRSLRPGQKVAVSLDLRSSEESLVVPWSAVLHDQTGGTWVYENVSPQVYTRRRVEVRSVNDGLAILAHGPAPGAKVVSVAAIEIFGTEFGIGK